MEFVIPKADFVRELGLSQRIVEKKNTIPILSNILIEATESTLGLTATDLEVSLRVHCAAEIREQGSITVSAKKLFEVVRALPDEDVRVRSNESHGVRIQCGRSEFKLVGLDPKDFPNLPECDYSAAWEVSSSLFRRMVAKVIFAITSDESRFPLAGALLLGSESELTLVSTDGHRLAIAQSDLGIKGANGDTRLLIPRKALFEVRQMAELGDAPIQCQVKDSHIYFRMGERALVARMIEDHFPKYEKVIPVGNDKRLKVDKMALEGAVRRAALLSSEKAKVVRFTFGSDALTISASNPELGEVREDLPLEFDGEEFAIAFNAQYVLDFVAVADTEFVELELKDASTQALLRPVVPEEGDSGDVRHKYVIMPMRL